MNIVLKIYNFIKYTYKCRFQSYFCLSDFNNHTHQTTLYIIKNR